MDERFARALDTVLGHEGGYVRDPQDPGGETKFGISKRSYPDLEIKTLTRDQAAAIYFRDWWERYGYGAIEDPELAAKVFDLAVNLGPSTAHGLLQEAVNETSGEISGDIGPAIPPKSACLKVDGRLGPATLAAVNSHQNPAHLLAALKLAAVRRYLRLNKPRFMGGIKRAVS